LQWRTFPTRAFETWLKTPARTRRFTWCTFAWPPSYPHTHPSPPLLALPPPLHLPPSRRPATATTTRTTSLHHARPVAIPEQRAISASPLPPRPRGCKSTNITAALSRMAWAWRFAETLLLTLSAGHSTPWMTRRTLYRRGGWRRCHPAFHSRLPEKRGDKTRIFGDVLCLRATRTEGYANAYLN